MDLDDAVNKRLVPGKRAYEARARGVAKSQEAQDGRDGAEEGDEGACREVVRKKGAATGF